MTTERQVTILLAAAVLRGLSIDLVDSKLRQNLNDLADAVKTTVPDGTEDWVAMIREDVVELMESLTVSHHLSQMIVGLALEGVIHLLVP